MPADILRPVLPLKLSSSASSDDSSRSEYASKAFHRTNRPKSGLPKTHSTLNTKFIILALHSVPLVVYVVLIVVHSLALERRFSPSSTVLNGVVHVLVTLFCALFVAVLQPLATRARFQRATTLTALSDYAYSWNGLGPSILTLYRNMRLAANILPIITISVYFASIAGLQIVTPLLFSFTSVNVTSLRSVPMMVSFPVFNDSAYFGNFSDPESAGAIASSPGGMVLFDWHTGSSALGFGSANSGIDISGAVGNMVYDTLLFNSDRSVANGTVPVNVTQFHVNCGQLPQNITVRAMPIMEGGAQITFSSDDASFPFQMTDYISSYGFISDSVVAKPNLQSLFRIPQSQTFNNSMGRNLVLYARNYPPGSYSMNASNPNDFVSPLIDAAGSFGPAINLSITILHDEDATNVTGALPTFIQPLQVIGCSLSTSRSLAILDTATNTLAAGVETDAGTLIDKRDNDSRNSLWGGWRPDNGAEDGISSGWWPGMFQPLSSLPSTLPESNILNYVDLGDHDASNATAHDDSCPPQINGTKISQNPLQLPICHTSTAVETYLSNLVYDISKKAEAGYISYKLSNNYSTLSNLERVLEVATALTMQASVQTDSIGAVAISDGGHYIHRPSLLGTQTREATVIDSQPESRLEIELLPLAAGTALSLVLLATCAIILRQGTGHKSGHGSLPFKEVNLLEVMSFDASRVATRLIDAGTAGSTIAQRRSGMFLVSTFGGQVVPVEDEEHIELMSGRDDQSEESDVTVHGYLVPTLSQ